MDNSIKERRESLNFSQEELAKAVGISRTHLSEIENNKVNPTLKVAFGIAQALRIPINKIFYTSTVKKKQHLHEMDGDFYAIGDRQ